MIRSLILVSQVVMKIKKKRIVFQFKKLEKTNTTNYLIKKKKYFKVTWELNEHQISRGVIGKNQLQDIYETFRLLSENSVCRL